MPEESPFFVYESHRQAVAHVQRLRSGRRRNGKQRVSRERKTGELGIVTSCLSHYTSSAASNAQRLERCARNPQEKLGRPVVGVEFGQAPSNMPPADVFWSGATWSTPHGDVKMSRHTTAQHMKSAIISPSRARFEACGGLPTRRPQYHISLQAPLLVCGRGLTCHQEQNAETPVSRPRQSHDKTEEPQAKDSHRSLPA